MITDINDIEINNGSIIDIHQTVNGCRYFVILKTNPLDIRYGYDLTHEYQYNKTELLSKSRFTNEVDFEIIGNIYDVIPKN